MCIRKQDGERPLGRTKHRWEVNIKMGFQEINLGAWTGLMWLKMRTVRERLWMRL
jgi:hypothetical protein